MGWFAKDKKEERKFSEGASVPPLPDLPDLPDLPPLKTKFSDFPKEQALPALPSFPTSSTGEMISRQMVKQAVRGEEDEESEEYYSEIKPAAEIEYPKFERKFKEKPVFFKQSEREKEIYIKLDKYQEALLNFEKIKAKIIEIDSLLRDIREIKTKEEFELKNWESEIQEAKNKLTQIDNALFRSLGE